MAWEDVDSTIRFWSQSTQWALGPGHSMTDVSAGDQQAIKTYLQSLYNGSAQARAMLEAGAATGNIRIGTSAVADTPGIFGGGSGGFFYIGVDLNLAEDTYYFNKTGEFVKEKPDLTIAHELAHAILGLTNSQYLNDPQYNESAMNGASFDFDGATVRKQNAIASEMGYSDNIQVSYHSGILSSDDRYSKLTTGSSYTDNKEINIVRFGDDLGVVTNDNLDMTLRTDKSKDLMFGFGGNDQIWGGDGDDFIYGGDGIDTLDGGAGRDAANGEKDGYDFLDGGEGNDILYGGAGDILTGGDGDDIFYLFTSNVVQLLDDGVMLPGGDDAKYQDSDKWLLDTMDVLGNPHDIWAIPIVEITDYEAGDKIYVDGKLITGKTVTYSDDEYVSGTFSWMTAIGDDQGDDAPYSDYEDVALNTISFHHVTEHYFDTSIPGDEMGRIGNSAIEFYDFNGVFRLNQAFEQDMGNLVYTAGLILSIPDLPANSFIDTTNYI